MTPLVSLVSLATKPQLALHYEGIQYGGTKLWVYNACKILQRNHPPNSYIEQVGKDICSTVARTSTITTLLRFLGWKSHGQHAVSLLDPRHTPKM